MNVSSWCDIARLNSKDLEVVSVSLVQASHPLGGSKAFVDHVASFHSRVDVPFTVDKPNDFLIVRAVEPRVPAGTHFVLSVCGRCCSDWLTR